MLVGTLQAGIHSFVVLDQLTPPLELSILTLHTGINAALCGQKLDPLSTNLAVLWRRVDLAIAHALVLELLKGVSKTRLCMVLIGRDEPGCTGETRQ